MPFFPSLIYTQCKIMTMQKQKQVFGNVFKRITEILHWHKYSDPLLSSNFNLLKLCLSMDIFRFLLFDWVHVWTIQGNKFVPKPLFCHGCELRVIFLLEGQPSAHFGVLSALYQLSGTGFVCTLFSFLSILTSLPVPASEKTPSIGRVMSSVWFPLDMKLHPRV